MLDSDAEKLKVAIEFHGCAFLGCDCQPPGAAHPFSKVPNHEVNENTKRRTMEISSLGVVVIEVWECKLKAALAANETLNIAFRSVVCKQPFLYRDSFFGGRTEAVV